MREFGRARRGHTLVEPNDHAALEQAVPNETRALISIADLDEALRTT